MHLRGGFFYVSYSEITLWRGSSNSVSPYWDTTLASVNAHLLKGCVETRRGNDASSLRVFDMSAALHPNYCEICWGLRWHSDLNERGQRQTPPRWRGETKRLNTDKRAGQTLRLKECKWQRQNCHRGRVRWRPSECPAPIMAFNLNQICCFFSEGELYKHLSSRVEESVSPRRVDAGALHLSDGAVLHKASHKEEGSATV